MNTNETYKVRPAGRHLLTIGRDLIQDSYAAVVELVKNAYDADSPDVNIEFKAKSDSSGYSIVIADHGHGMSPDTVINKWMVPSTRDKLDRKESPAGRVMQGRKGVGRYAASILGDDLLLETITPQGEKTTVYIEWEKFETAQYLDDVEILIETSVTSEQSGTRLTIVGGNDFLEEWNEKQFKSLRFELKKLIPPVSAAIIDKSIDSKFQINLKIDAFSNISDVDEIIEPYPIFDLFDYRIAGKINADGKGSLIYSQQKARNTTDEHISFDVKGPTGCGDVIYDIRVYDREAEAIGSLIGRGLKDESGNYVGKLQARELLNEYNGIGVYRNGFRIRPLGDAKYDWLKLNEQRVQNPSLRIGSNQVIGYVQIQSDELSGLIEKSARDGLRENRAFAQLGEITTKVIAELEQRRFAYRKKVGLSRPVLKIEKEIESLFSYDTLKKDIQSKLNSGGVDKKTTEEIIELIDQDAKVKNKASDEIRQAVAIYQGQATLGKIINVILHEGRRPLSCFRNQIPRIRKKTEEFKKKQVISIANELQEISKEIGDNADIFVNLFSRLDPLSSSKRSPKKPFNLRELIQYSISVFENEIEEGKIITKVVGPQSFTLSCWDQDIRAIFVNLVDNSVFWIKEKKPIKREISIDYVTDGNSLLHIDYRDTGPGIELQQITSEIIFEPQFSTKPSGTGLGLAIAGEAAARNGLELRALQSDTGAYFRLQPINKEIK